jgi:cytochrome P450
MVPSMISRLGSSGGAGSNDHGSSPSTGLGLFLTSVVASTVYLYYFPNVPWLPGIPVQGGNSILGYTKVGNEQAALKMLKEKGPLVQFKSYGRYLLFIADKELARTALRDVVGKGFFHNSTPKLTTSSIFSHDTGPEWTRRRTTFRKAFSTVCLKTHMNTVAQMSGRMIRYLEKEVDKASDGFVVPIDDVFIHMTIGVICEVAFEMNVNAFEESSDYGKHMDGVMKELFKVC